VSEGVAMLRDSTGLCVMVNQSGFCFPLIVLTVYQ
jgi:hypothetical protein